MGVRVCGWMGEHVILDPRSGYCGIGWVCIQISKTVVEENLYLALVH